MHISEMRELCKKDFDKLKNSLKSKRSEYGDLNIVEIEQNIDTRIVNLDKEQKKLDKIYVKQGLKKQQKDEDNLNQMKIYHLLRQIENV